MPEAHLVELVGDEIEDAFPIRLGGVAAIAVVPAELRKSGGLTEQPGTAPCWQSDGDGRPGVNVSVRPNGAVRQRRGNLQKADRLPTRVMTRLEA